MNTSSTTATHSAHDSAMGQLQAYLTVAEAAALLRRKPYSLVKAIEAGELRASMPSNDGAWLIRPEDLLAYVERFTSGAQDTAWSHHRRGRNASGARWRRRWPRGSPTLGSRARRLRADAVCQHRANRPGRGDRGGSVCANSADGGSPASSAARKSEANAPARPPTGRRRLHRAAHPTRRGLAL